MPPSAREPSGTTVLVLCGLTLAIYPVHYDGLINRGELTERALAFLTARNLGLLALVGTLVVTAPKWLGWLLRAGIRIAVQLAILGLVLRYVSSFWPF